IRTPEELLSRVPHEREERVVRIDDRTVDVDLTGRLHASECIELVVGLAALGARRSAVGCLGRFGGWGFRLGSGLGFGGTAGTPLGHFLGSLTSERTIETKRDPLPRRSPGYGLHSKRAGYDRRVCTPRPTGRG